MKNKIGFSDIKKLFVSTEGGTEDAVGLKIDKVVISEVKFVEREVTSQDRGMLYELVSHTGTVFAWAGILLSSYMVAFQ